MTALEQLHSEQQQRIVALQKDKVAVQQEVADLRQDNQQLRVSRFAFEKQPC
jgi:hypothetical protein